MAFEGYMALVKRFQLRPIRDEAQHKAAIEMVRELAIGYENLGLDEMDYFDGLSQFVADYEAQHHKMDLSHLTPLDVLKFLMAENQMSTADLGRVLGSRSAASMVLSGERELSKAYIRLLSDRFGIDAGLLLGAKAPSNMDVDRSDLWSRVTQETDAGRWTVTQSRAPQSKAVFQFAESFEYRMAG